MVAARLYGGLGNQMFQYAAALATAARLGARLVLDASWFSDVGPQAGRAYGLDAFAIEPGPTLRDRLELLVRRPRVVREGDIHEPHELAALRAPVVLDGYWQSALFFAGFEDRVREAFRFRGAPTPAHAALLDEVHKTQSVSVHVRRGDYLAPKRQARFGLLSPEYYDVAMSLVRERVDAPRFVVFSDDPDWCRSHFGRSADVTVAPSRPEAPHEDLRVMAACVHHVVANSSFSWWGAWLGEQAGKLVVAPETWYVDPTLAPWEIVPADWLRV